MSYFDTYFSNTGAPTNNQKFYAADPDELQAARSYIKLAAGGEHTYSLLFANQVASTFADGAESFANYVCAGWEILSIKLALCRSGFEPGEFIPLSFDGCPQKRVAPGEIFSTDPVRISAKAGDRLCLEMTYRGREIPYLHEILLKGERLLDGEWQESIFLPRPILVGCDRPVRRRLVFMGDSITEGIGTPIESYAGYAQIAATALGDEFGYWNIGLGYGRAADAASGGLWFYEAKQGDVVSVCFGVNDILRDYGEAEIKKSLSTLVTRLKAEGCLVILQTIPPFDFQGEKAELWDRVNDYIRAELAPTVDLFFDNRPILCGEDGYSCPYGGHPNEEGAALWGAALAKAIQKAGI